MAQVITSFIDRIQLGEDEAHQIAIGSSAYGICNTAANNTNKIVYLPGFKLNTGTTIHVHFIYGNTAINPTLNINALTYEAPNTPPPIESISGVSIDDLPEGAILTLTYDGTAWVKDYGGTGSGEDNIDLTGVMRIIGQVDSTSEYQPSHMTWGTPTLSGIASGEYSPQVGDVISDADGTHEYMCVNVDDSYGGFWFMVGTIMPEYDSDRDATITNAAGEPPLEGDPLPFTWISKITQNTDGSISTKRTPLGIVPIANGGTGTDSFSENQVIISDSTGDSLTSVPYSDYNSTNDPNGESVPSLNPSSTNFVTERYIYFGLPILNNTHNYNFSSTYYAPTTGGTAGHILIGAGTTDAPAWYGGTVMSGSATTNWITAFKGTTDATATNAAAVTIAGGLGIKKKLYVGDTAIVPNLTIGTTNEYGDAYTPIYWHEGIPTVVTPIQQYAFTINSGKSGVKLSHAAITINSYVTQIVITEGESNLNSDIEWESAAGYINLTCSATSGTVKGYILVSRGGAIKATTTNIPNT